MLVGDCFHPKFLLDATKRDLHLFSLWNVVKENPKLGKIVRSEIKDLNNLDIPYFYSKCNSREIYDGFDRLIDDEFFIESGIYSVQKRINKLSYKDLNRQLFFIKTSMFGYNIKGTKSLIKKGLISSKIRYHSKIIFDEFDSNKRMNNIVNQIASRLVNLRIESETNCDWFNCIIKDNYVFNGIFDLSMFSGSVGKLYFLAWAGKQYKNDEFVRVAKKVIKTIIDLLNKSSTNINLPTGLYYGWGGVIQLLINLPNSFKTKELDTLVDSLLDRVKSYSSEDGNNDVMYGNSGLIMALYCVKNLKYKKKINEIIRMSGSRLLCNIKIKEEKLSWEIEALKSGNQVSGLSHGNSGIALALFISYQVTKNEKFYEVLLIALKNERMRLKLIPSDFVKTNFITLKNCSLTTGVTGVLLSRLQLKKIGFMDGFIDEEIELLANNILKVKSKNNHSIATGVFSKIELLRMYSNQKNDLILDAKVNSLLKSSIEEIENSGVKTNNIIHLEDLSLFNGITGVGYQLMREVFPGEIPSILNID